LILNVVVGMTGLSRDELFGQFFAALEKMHFFRQLLMGTMTLRRLFVVHQSRFENLPAL
jgi:hypothetical protein